MNILNLVTDQIFINDLVEVCEFTKGKHRHDYVVISEEINPKFKFIKSPKVHTVSLQAIVSYVKEKSIDVVVMHSLLGYYYDMILSLPKDIKLVWFAWGFDLYTAPHFMKPFVKVNLYHKETLKLVMGGLKNKLSIYHGLIHSLMQKSKIDKAINRIDLFSGVVREEYDMMKKYPAFRAQELSFNYFSLSSQYIEDADLTFDNLIGNNIMVGNSGDPCNNHIDAFKVLYDRGLTNHKIYVPLSYGGNEKYVKHVIEYGEKCFGDNFVPLKDFLPYNDYVQILASCSNVVMFHERQQAMGNISMSLWEGKKVYLSKTSVAYKTKKNDGNVVYSIQEELNEENLATRLEQDKVIENRKVLLHYGSRQFRLRQMSKVYEDIENYKRM